LQVTLCDPIWHVSSRSGVATLRTAIHLLLLLTYALYRMVALPMTLRDFKFGTLIYHSKSHPADEISSLKGACSGSRKQFLHCGLRKFRHSKSSVYRWYTQLDRRRFVYDTYKTMKATRMRHGWVHMFITHRSTLTLQLHNFDLFRTCRTRVSALLRGNWRDFNWHDASRGHSAIAELLVDIERAICRKSSPILTYPTCIWRPRCGWPRQNFSKIFGTRIHGLSCDIVCVIVGRQHIPR